MLRIDIVSDNSEVFTFTKKCSFHCVHVHAHVHL